MPADVPSVAALRLVCHAVAIVAVGRLTGVFYCIQFERVPVEAVDRILRLVATGGLGVTLRELAAAIDGALGGHEPLMSFDFSGGRHSEAMLREFLVALRARLASTDALPSEAR